MELIFIAFAILFAFTGCNGTLNHEISNKEKLQQKWQKSFHEGYVAALKDHFHKNEKKYDIATLNQAARNRNPLLSSLGGDPYGMGTTILSKAHMSYGRKKRFLDQEMRKKRYISTPGHLKEAYSAGYAAGKEVVEKMVKEKNDPVKRFGIEKLNQAARHRNVYFDAVGGDPYGGSSVVSSRQHVNWQHTKRSVKLQDKNDYNTKAVQRLLRRVVKIPKKKFT